jgi:methyl-accepting chemotaxis protein
MAGEDNEISNGLAAAVDASFCVVELDPKGTVLRVNDGFLSLTEYDEAEVLGKHHSMFLSAGMAGKPDYEMDRADLQVGNGKRAVTPYVTKSGRRIWVEETYAPVRDGKGKVVRSVRFCADVTEGHETFADLQGKIDAIRHSHGVIEFDVTGTILNANQYFLSAMGYELSEITGGHYSMFADPADAKEADCQAFWKSLFKRAYRTGRFKHVGKGGREVWFEATYSPVFDPEGRICKIVAFAVDISDEVRARAGLKAVLDSGFADVDHSLDRFDQNFDNVARSCRQAQAHLEASSMVAGLLVGSVGETVQRMTDLRSIADHVFETVIEGNIAAVVLENAVDGLRDGVKECPDLIKKINHLDEHITENSRILATLRLELKEMLNRMATVSMAVEKHDLVAHQMTGEMHGIQTSLETSRDLMSVIVQSSEEVAFTVGRTRDASVLLVP